MELEVFAGQEKSELSMIEVARAILESRGRDHEMYFNDLKPTGVVLLCYYDCFFKYRYIHIIIDP